MKTALITGITGQDGSYLAELLLSKGYEVHGVVRRASMFNRTRIEHLRSDPLVGDRLHLHYADINDTTILRRLIASTAPEELYHLAGQSHPGISFDIPESTAAETAGATLSILEILRDIRSPPRMLHASSAEVFGSPNQEPQSERTSFHATTPYGCAKAYATDLCRIYRDYHGLFICNSIAYNHESPRRGESFVTRKITLGSSRIASGERICLELGNLESRRDWGYAPEYVEAMWRLLQLETPTDVVLATGTSTSVREFANSAFSAVGIDLKFSGTGVDEIGRDQLTGNVVLKINPRFFRPADPVRLVGDSSKAQSLFGWTPTTAGKDVAKRMAEMDLKKCSSAESVSDGRLG